MLGHWLKRCYLMCNEMHGHSAAKRYHCLSRRFLRTSKKWKQKSSERHDPQQINLMQGHWLKRYKLNWKRMHRQSATKCYHCSSEIPTDIMKLETKIIRKTRSTANQFDAATLTEVLQTEVGRNAQTLGCKMLPLFVKEIPTDVKKMETKVIWKTRSTANQFDAGTLTEALQTELEKNAQTVSYNMLLLFVKEIPTDITKLETKIIKYSIHKKSISCRHIETRSWTRIETKITQSQLKHYHCSSRDSYIHHETGTKNHNGGLNLRLSNLMLGHRLKRCYPMCNEMHWHPAAKCYHCLSKRIQRTTQNWEQKSSERHNPQQINLMLRHWLKHYKLKWNEMHRQSATTC